MGGTGGEAATKRLRAPNLAVFGRDGVREVLHTLLFVLVGLGTMLAYGLGTSSFTLPKWLFLVAGAAVVVLVAGLRLRSRRAIAFDAVDAALLAFVGYAGLSLLWAPDRAGSVLHLAGLVALAVLVLYARRCDAGRLAFRIALVSLITVAALLVRSVALPKSGGGFGNDNHFTGTLLLCVPFALLWFRLRAGPDRWLGPLLAAAGLAWLVAVNGSRLEYAVFAGLAGGAILLRTSHRLGRRPAFALFAAGTAAGLLVLWLGWDRLVEIYPFRERVELYLNTVAMWHERPLFGHGIGGFDYAFPRFQQVHLEIFPPDRYPAFGTISLYHAFRLADAAHNEALQIFAETGFAGGALAALFLYAPVRAALIRYDRSPFLFAASLAAGVLTMLAMLGSPFHSPSTAALGALALGILCRREDGDDAPFRIPLPSVSAAALAAAATLAFAGTFYLSLAAYRAGLDHGLSQALRARSSYVALALELRAHDRFPLSPEYRRQVYLNYVDWFAQTRERNNPRAPDEQTLFRTAMSAGPALPGLLLTRIRYLLLRRPGTYEREEIELRLSALKAWMPYLIEVHAAEVAYARSIGDYVRAEAALREAVRVKKLRDREPAG